MPVYAIPTNPTMQRNTSKKTGNQPEQPPNRKMPAMQWMLPSDET
jgi:hypothetical protein